MRLPRCAKMMDKPRRIDNLADELISAILSFLLGSECPPNEAHHTTSQDLSGGANGNSANVYGERSDLDRFRLVCRRFMRIGTPQKFPRFVLRFSRDGFQRLEDFLDMQLACHVRYFTYMVRPFYQGSGWPHLLNGIETDNPLVSNTHKLRFQDQAFIIDENRDLLLLRRAISAFSSLQQVKLLRLQDETDEQLLDYIDERSLGETYRWDWESACIRAVTSLGISLLESNCSSIRFVGPQISPKATVKLLQTPSTMLSALGARLTSLDITFSSSTDITATMGALSGVFHDFFLAAQNLTAIHFGFPVNTPLDLSLEQIFHRVQWKRLRMLSVQGWRLGSEEIITLARRHRRQLRDIRLTSIYLRDGGRWRDVLSFLHDEMEQLERIDLHEIDYANNFDADTVNGNGMSSFETFPALSIVTDPPSDPHPHQTILNVDYMSFSPRGNSRRSFSETTMKRLRALTADDLGDNGVCVKHEQRLLWEAWVLSGMWNVN